MNLPEQAIIHVPHASVLIPKNMQADFLIPDLQDELLRMTDRYCDVLFDCGRSMQVFPISRLVCDAERFRDDSQEIMSKKGMGLAYTRTADGRALRRVTPEMRARLLKAYYDPHHEALTGLVDERIKNDGHCLIIDGHSFYPTPLPYENDQDGDRPDFCIGTDAYHTPELLESVCVNSLHKEGYSVKVNSPFVGTLVPMKYYGRDARVMSVMIEINRRIYMNGHGERAAGFEKTRKTVAALIEKLEEETRSLGKRPQAQHKPV